MNIRILCVGKLKEKYWQAGVTEYSKRLSAYCNLTIQEIKESSNDSPEEEGKEILKKIGSGDYVITLEIAGRVMPSEGLAETIGALALEGNRRVVFVIGGSEGLSRGVRERGDLALSFSAMTFPHQMMRVILLEQIYRAFKILRRETYHK